MDLKEDAMSDMEGNMFAPLIEGLVSSVQIQYGWAVLIIGNLLVFLAAGYKSRLNKIFTSKQYASEVSNKP